jgi:hypothetical protein
MSDEKPLTRAERAAAQEQRAMDALAAIFAGGDLTAEAEALANEFTDRQTARLRNVFRRRT